MYFEMIAHKVALNYNNKKFKYRRNEYVDERKLMTPKRENRYLAFHVLLNYLRRKC